MIIFDRESFYIETNGDTFMRSARSDNVNPFHMSNYKVLKSSELPKFTDSTSYFQPKTKLQKLGETIQKHNSYNFPDISEFCTFLQYRKTRCTNDD